jgi:uncharacterized membrane protein
LTFWGIIEYNKREKNKANALVFFGLFALMFILSNHYSYIIGIICVVISCVGFSWQISCDNSIGENSKSIDINNEFIIKFYKEIIENSKESV